MTPAEYQALLDLNRDYDRTHDVPLIPNNGIPKPDKCSGPTEEIELVSRTVTDVKRLVCACGEPWVTLDDNCSVGVPTCRCTDPGTEWYLIVPAPDTDHESDLLENRQSLTTRNVTRKGANEGETLNNTMVLGGGDGPVRRPIPMGDKAGAIIHKACREANEATACPAPRCPHCDATDAHHSTWCSNVNPLAGRLHEADHCGLTDLSPDQGDKAIPIPQAESVLMWIENALLAYGDPYPIPRDAWCPACMGVVGSVHNKSCYLS